MIALIGMTCTGKDTTLQDLIKLGYEPIVSYTTRPKREGEINGVTYHFVSDDEFELLRSRNIFAETTEYRVASEDIWKYGTARLDLKGDKVMIVNPEGLKNLKKEIK